MQRARAQAVLALLARRQQQQQQLHHHEALASAVSAAAGDAARPTASGGGERRRAPIAAAATTAAWMAAEAAATTAAATTISSLPWRHVQPWAVDSLLGHQQHHRTFFSWGGGRGGGGGGNKAPPPPVVVDADEAAAAAAASSSSSSLPPPPLVSLDDAAASGSPTAAGTGILERFDAALASSSPAASTAAAAAATPPDAAAAADLSAAAAAVLDATRSAEAEAFVAAAADVWAPTRVFMGMLQAASEAWGLPWWATIALVNLGVRCATLPLTVYTQKKAGGVAQLNEKMAAVRELAAAQSRATSMREYQALQARRAAAMAELQAKHGGELRSSLVVPALGVLNAVVLVSQFSAVSTLAGEGVPSMARGGALWFPDLTVPDANYGLAAICSALTLAMIEFGGLTELGQTMPGAASGGMRWLLRGMALLFLPAGAYVPAAVGVLWTGNAVLSLAQSTALRSPGVRKALGLPDMAKVRADQRKALGGAAGGGLLAALTGGAAGGAAAGGGGAAAAAAAGKVPGVGGGAVPPPGQAPASSLLSTGRLYAQPSGARKSAKQIRDEVAKQVRR